MIRLLDKDKKAVQTSFAKMQDWKLSFLLGPNGKLIALNSGRENFVGVRITQKGIKEEGDFQNYILVKESTYLLNNVSSNFKLLNNREIAFSFWDDKQMQ